MEQKQIDLFLKKVSKFALKGDYKSALKITERYFKEYPSEFICQYQHAKILGDYADELPLAKKKKLKGESIRLLRPLLRRMKGQSFVIRFGICLNYYYQSENFKGMYSFGKRIRRYNQQKSEYALGLASAQIAQSLHEKGKSSQSRLWARKSIQHWKRYHLNKETYYFAHYTAAKANALAGMGKISYEHLKKAAQLGRRPITDWEFADVLSLVPGPSSGR